MDDRSAGPVAREGVRLASKINIAPALAGAMTAYIALGSNLGDRELFLGKALGALEEMPDLRVGLVARVLENPAVGGPPDSPPFLNTVAEIQTSLGPKALLEQLLKVEQLLGRERREKWGPRTIDLDLLIHGDSIVQSEDLILPHPRLHERRFVLQPLAEIAPVLIVPGLGKTVSELLAALG